MGKRRDGRRREEMGGEGKRWEEKGRDGRSQGTEKGFFCYQTNGSIIAG